MPPRLARLSLLILMTTLSVAPVLAQAPPGFEAAWQPIRAFYTEGLEENGIVGSSLVLLHDGAVLAEEYYGFADLETQRRVDANTIYHWASITKTFTGIALLQLRDRGLLSLDDPVVAYLPELKKVHNPFGPMEAITLRHLLSHSSGFRASTWPWSGEETWHPYEPTKWAQLVAMLPYTEIHFAPGSRYGYSNPGIIFLGRIIEQLTGDDYEVYVDKNILKPLRMHRSYFDHTPYHLLQHRSNNYSVRDGQPHANGLDFDTGITVSNGGLNAPLTDMVLYLNFLMGDAEKQAAYDGVLPRVSLEEMWVAQHEVAQRGPFEETVGLAFHLMERDGFRVVGHTGSQQAFRAFFYVDPITRTGAIANFNTAGGGDQPPDTRAFMNAVRERLFEEIFPLFDDE